MAFQRNARWAYIVALASCLSSATIEVLVRSNQIYYTYMIDYYEQPAKFVGFAISISRILKGLLGLFAAVIINRFSCRPVAFVSSLFIIVGYLIIYLSTSSTELVISSFFTGVGISLVYFANFYILDKYFERHFTLVISLLMTVKAICTILTTPLNQIFVMVYGWKPAHLILAGLACQITVCSSVYKTPKKKDCGTGKNFHQYLAKSPKQWLGKIYELGHFSLFKNRAFQILIFASFLHVAVSESTHLMMTDSLSERGAKQIVSQSIGTIYGIGNLLGRPFHYICSKFLSENLMIHLALCFSIGSLALLISISFSSVESMFLYIFLYSFSSSWLDVVKPLFIKTKTDDFSFAFAWVTFVSGFSNCVILFIGFLRDATGTYWASEFLLCMMEFIGLFTILLVIFSKKI